MAPISTYSDADLQAMVDQGAPKNEAARRVYQLQTTQASGEIARRTEAMAGASSAGDAALADQQAKAALLQQRAEQQRNDQLGQTAAYERSRAAQQQQVQGMQDAAANLSSSLSIIGDKAEAGPGATQTKRAGGSSGSKAAASRSPGQTLRANPGVGLNIGI
jgi:hypothetical protein